VGFIMNFHSACLNDGLRRFIIWKNFVHSSWSFVFFVLKAFVEVRTVIGVVKKEFNHRSHRFTQIFQRRLSF
jgi:hypothetical protein